GGVSGRRDPLRAPGPGARGSPFGGHPLAYAAAIKTIEGIERGGLAARATAIGATLRRRFEAMAKSQAGIGEVRGVGAMQAIALVQDRRTKKPAPVDAIIKRACERGLLVLRAGLYSNVIRTLVPLTITDPQLEEGLDILEGSIDG